MNFQALFAPHANKSIRAGLIGVGQFGVSFVSQARHVDCLEIAVLCDRDVEHARLACSQAGIDAQDTVICDSRAAALRALQTGKCVIVADSDLLLELPLDIVVEATGNPAAGASNAAAAIEHGHHVAMVSKEADSVVGPLLQARARRAGVMYTPVDGDQPALLIGLISWAKTLGLRIVTAGKSSEYDFVYDPTRETVTWTDRTVPVPGFRDLWQLPPEQLSATLARRSECLAEIPQRTVPDLCEMGVVANATGMKPDTPMFHLPVARTREVADVFCPREDGGLLGRSGVIDVFNCLRRPDEASFAGGVFIVVACEDRQTWRMLKSKGIPVSRNGAYGLLYNPQHLLGLEAPLSILAACLLGLPSGAVESRPVCDVVARTTRVFRTGEALRIDDVHHHEIGGVEPMLVDAAPINNGSPVPYYLAAGARLTRDVPAATVVTRGMIEQPADSVLWRLRAEQDHLFFRSEATVL